MSISSMAKLSGLSQEFITTVRGGTREKNAIVALACARAVLDRLQMPSAPVENSVEYFTTQYKEQIATLIGEINEMCVIDFEQAIDFINTLWKMKYKFVFPQGRLFSNYVSSFATFLGLSSLVTPELFKIIDSEEKELVRLTNGFIDLLGDLAPLPADKTPEQKSNENVLAATGSGAYNSGAITQ